MLKKYFILTAAIVFGGLALYCQQSIQHETVKGENYTQYPYEPQHGADEEAYEFEDLEKRETLLSEGKTRLEWSDFEDPYNPIETSAQDLKDGILFKLQFQDKIYVVQSISDNDPNTNPETNYRILENGTEIFRHEMEFGAEGPVYREEFIEGGLALEFRTKEGSDIYYQGKLLSETYGLKNPSFLFLWDGKLGFFAQKEDGLTYLFFDGQAVSPAFDQVHVISCCANFFFLPQLYEGGIVVFKAERNGTPSFVEVQL